VRQTLQRYAYASDDPIIGGDPSGMWACHRGRAANFADKWATSFNRKCAGAPKMIHVVQTRHKLCLYDLITTYVTSRGHNDDCTDFASQPSAAGGVPLVGTAPNGSSHNVWWATWVYNAYTGWGFGRSNSWTVRSPSMISLSIGSSLGPPGQDLP